VSKPKRPPKLLSREEIRKIQRENVTDAQALAVVKAQRAYEAQLRSGWDTYQGAVAAAQGGHASRLVDLLHAGRQLTTDECEQLTGFIRTKRRQRTWPSWLGQALKSPTEGGYEQLAGLIEQIGRRRGGVTDESAHRAANIALSFIAVFGRVNEKERDELIERACHIIEDEERCSTIDRERVRNLLDHPRARMNEPRRPKKQ
jgi:hypothetical protein